LEKNGELVAIKIVQRFSKKRRLGKVTVAPEDKTKREIAILKKIRHPNVVGLLEVIDDPEFKKIYMILEYVELGEIVWRKKGVTHICQNERRRIDKEKRGEDVQLQQDEQYLRMMARRAQRTEFKRQQLARHAQAQDNYWSLEHGNDDDDESVSRSLDRHITHDSAGHLSRSHGSGITRSDAAISRPVSRVQSRASSRTHTPLPNEFDIGPLDSDNEEDEDSKPISGTRSNASNYGSATALEGTYFGAYAGEETPYRARSPSMADSIASHMSSVGENLNDLFEDDFSYVPCFTIAQARLAFRDTVLGLEYLHYEGIVHRDIKPANLLWTKDHRVKISDFGVSYFGRPIRNNEDEYVTEAEATDFDDDLELSKTVGTPAFFAPELCYTDLDKQPKVTEQIDVWSLGVTLYCLIFARIPFLADDEWQLFKAIAKEDVYIPRRRLMAVNPDVHGSQLDLIHRIGPTTGEYRDDAELRYEDIDDELYDLLRRMLEKDPSRRINLRAVKHHPWTLRHIKDYMGWIDDTDPARNTSGRKIQVDRNELEKAVVPFSFMERARSVVKKAVGKVINVARSETRQDSSRRRAKSSANSSGTDTAHNSPLTPILRDSRRSSIRGDEHYFASVSDLQEQVREYTSEHPLSQSVTASPAMATTKENEQRDPFFHNLVGQSSSAGATPNVMTGAPRRKRPNPPDRAVSTAGSIQTVVHRGHSYSRSATSSLDAIEDGNTTPGPFTDHLGGIFGGHLWTPRGRDQITEEIESPNRTKSADRSLFKSESKHSNPVVATTHAIAGGQLSHAMHPFLYQPRPLRSPEISPTHKHTPSPLIFQKYMVQGVTASASAPNVPNLPGNAELEKRPATANMLPEPKTPAPRIYGASTPESFERAQKEQDRRRRQEIEAEQRRREFSTVQTQASPVCPPSPDDETFQRRQEETSRAQSYSSVNSNALSQATSASDVHSPISTKMGSAEQFYPSVPSLPALVSGASSVSADTEGDMLGHPGIVHQLDGSMLDSMSEGETPPANSKAASLNADQAVVAPATVEVDGTLIMPESEEDIGYQGDIPDEDDSDSDEGLTMSRKKPVVKKDGESSAAASRWRENKRPVRKDTSTSIATITSIGSTETAKGSGFNG